MAHVGAIIGKAQITNGGPVILWQAENEFWTGSGVPFPNKPYFQYVIDQARNAGIVIPIINNDAFANGDQVPGTGIGSVDIYVHNPQVGAVEILTACRATMLTPSDSAA
jgi:Glycosyl hydrolases family 35